jgi:hypothetical protein
MYRVIRCPKVEPRDSKMDFQSPFIDRGWRLEFRRIKSRAIALADQLVPRWLPHGRRIGSEWVARNPTRADRHLGSFKVSLRTGRWADFATGDSGGDLISLRAYLDGIQQGEAARRVSRELGL